MILVNESCCGRQRDYMEIVICSRGFVLPLHEFKSKQSENYIFRLFLSNNISRPMDCFEFFSFIIMSEVLI